VDRPGTHLNPQANVHSDPIVRSSKSSLSGEVVAEEANTRMREVCSAPSIFWHESEQGDQLHQRAVRYMTRQEMKQNMLIIMKDIFVKSLSNTKQRRIGLIIF